MEPCRSPGDPASEPSDPLSAPVVDQASEGEATQQQAIQAQYLNLQQRGLSGANWFFWIAGLSLVNSVILLSGSNTYFVIGLGVTLVADLFANAMAQEHPQVATVVTAVAFGFDLVVALVVVLFGWLARKRFQSIYALGMFLYLLDGAVYVWAEDWMSVAFHAFALFCMWSGFSSFRQLNALERALAQPTLAPTQVPGNPQGF